jgi:GntR family transcriptional regulator
MFITVDLYSAKSAYLQIAECVREAIAAGSLRAGDRLPPIRETAVQTRVNRNTVSRAYLELEHMGLVQARQGSGFFVTDLGEQREIDARMGALDSAIDELVIDARLARLSEQELLDRVRSRFQSASQDKGDNHE